MKILKKALLYDIANMAYLIADKGIDNLHSLHRVRDICEEGNLDRVSRVLGLAYSKLLAVLSPVLISQPFREGKDYSAKPHDYFFEFKKTGFFRYSLTPEIKLKIKETAHEFMVCMVLADWLGVVYPEAADVWKFRFEKALESLREITGTLENSSVSSFRRRLNPW